MQNLPPSQAQNAGPRRNAPVIQLFRPDDFNSVFVSNDRQPLDPAGKNGPAATPGSGLLESDIRHTAGVPAARRRSGIEP